MRAIFAHANTNLQAHQLCVWLWSQAVGISWLAGSWATCYAVQPARFMASKVSAERAQQAFQAAERYSNDPQAQLCFFFFSALLSLQVLEGP